MTEMTITGLINFWTLVLTFSNPTLPSNLALTTKSISYHATESLCDEALLDRRFLIETLKPELPYILTCDPPK